MVAKRFFYVSAGLLCLALAYHLGAQNARAQAGSGVIAVALGNSGQGLMLFGVDEQGQIYAGQACFGNGRPFVPVGFLPGGAVANCMTTDANGGMALIGCTNGDVYTFSPFEFPNVHPVLCGRMTTGPTSAQRSSFGAVKARYR